MGLFQPHLQYYSLAIGESMRRNLKVVAATAVAMRKKD